MKTSLAVDEENKQHLESLALVKAQLVAQDQKIQKLTEIKDNLALQKKAHKISELRTSVLSCGFWFPAMGGFAASFLFVDSMQVTMMCFVFGLIVGLFGLVISYLFIERFMTALPPMTLLEKKSAEAYTSQINRELKSYKNGKLPLLAKQKRIGRLLEDIQDSGGGQISMAISTEMEGALSETVQQDDGALSKADDPG